MKSLQCASIVLVALALLFTSCSAPIEVLTSTPIPPTAVPTGTSAPTLAPSPTAVEEAATAAPTATENVPAWVPPTYQGADATLTFACESLDEDYYGPLAEAFHQIYPNITVQVISFDEIAEDPNETMPLVPVARAADAFTGLSTNLTWFLQYGIVLDLTELVQADKTFLASDFYTGVLAPFYYQGKLWGLPTDAQMELLYYDPELFDAANVPYPQAGWSWDDFMQAAAQLTVRQGDEVTQWGYVHVQSQGLLFPLVYQKTGPLVDAEKDPVEVKLDRPQVAEALRWYADLAEVYGVMPNIAALDPDALNTQMHDQELHYQAMWTDSSWYLGSEFRDERQSAIAPFPAVDQAAADTPGASCVSTALYISAGTQQAEATWRWIDYLSHQSPRPVLFDIPARKSVAQEMDLWKDLSAEDAAMVEYNLEHAVSDPEQMGIALFDMLEEVLGGKPEAQVVAEWQQSESRRVAERAAAAQAGPETFTVATAVPTPSDDQVVLQFAVLSGLDLAAYRALAERFAEEHPGVVIEVSKAPNWFLDKNVQVADCFVSVSNRLQYDDTSVVLPLEPFIDLSKFDLTAFSPAFLREARVDGQLLALPIQTDTYWLYYNKDILAASGVSVPNGGWTPAEFIAQVLALTNADGSVYGYSSRQGYWGYLDSTLTWLGAKLYDSNGQPTFDDPSVAEALAQYATLIERAAPADLRDDRPPFNLNGGVNTMYPPLVAEGQAALWLESYYTYQYMAKINTLPFEVGVVAPPAGGGPLFPAGRAYAMFISATTKHPQEAWEWISWLSTQPEAVSLLPVRLDILENAQWRERAGEEVAQAWTTVLTQEAARDEGTAQAADTRAAYFLQNALEQVLAGTPAEAALAEAQRQAEVYMACVAQGKDWRTCAQEADPEVILPQ